MASNWSHTRGTSWAGLIILSLIHMHMLFMLVILALTFFLKGFENQILRVYICNAYPFFHLPEVKTWFWFFKHIFSMTEDMILLNQLLVSSFNQQLLNKIVFAHWWDQISDPRELLSPRISFSSMKITHKCHTFLKGFTKTQFKNFNFLKVKTSKQFYAWLLCILNSKNWEIIYIPQRFVR